MLFGHLTINRNRVLTCLEDCCSVFRRRRSARRWVAQAQRCSLVRTTVTEKVFTAVQLLASVTVSERVAAREVANGLCRLPILLMVSVGRVSRYDGGGRALAATSAVGHGHVGHELRGLVYGE